MKRVGFECATAVLLAAGFLNGCAEQRRSRMSIDPGAEAALRKMSDTLGQARSLSFDATALMDEHIAPGQLAQSIRHTRVVLRRPDGLFVESHQGDDVWVLWYQGKSLTLLDQTANSFASVQVPGRIDQMLDDAAAKHGLTLPMADLMFSDPYRVMTDRALTGRYLGLHEVDGVKCHHLLFTQEAFDWQIWIDPAAEPLPRKLVIDYKNVPDRPQFTALLSDWKLSAPVGNEQFSAAVPDKAKKVELAKLLREEQGD